MASSPKFDGATYNAQADGERLKKQFERVREIMCARRETDVWLMATEVAKLVGNGAREPAIQARIRDLRKPQFGGFVVAIRRRGDPRAGAWEYKLLGGAEKLPEGARLLGERPKSASGRPSKKNLARGVLDLLNLCRELRDVQQRTFSPEFMELIRWLKVVAKPKPTPPKTPAK